MRMYVQVSSKDFFVKTLPLFDAGDDVGMVLSPQCFHNLNLHTDIFNHSNVHFWRARLPAAVHLHCMHSMRSDTYTSACKVSGMPQRTCRFDWACMLSSCLARAAAGSAGVHLQECHLILSDRDMQRVWHPRREYMQPGYDAMGFISCTGTNFLVPSTASAACKLGS